MNDWSLKDVPIAKFNVNTTIDPIKQEIKQITEIAGRVETQIWDLKEKQLREALINMGWTPPG